jgi:hypothetical protein
LFVLQKLLIFTELQVGFPDENKQSFIGTFVFFDCQTKSLLNKSKRTAKKARICRFRIGSSIFTIIWANVEKS